MSKTRGRQEFATTQKIHDPKRRAEHKKEQAHAMNPRPSPKESDADQNRSNMTCPEQVLRPSIRQVETRVPRIATQRQESQQSQIRPWHGLYVRLHPFIIQL